MRDAKRFSIEDTLVIKGIALIVLLTLHLFARSEGAWKLFHYGFMIEGKPWITALISGGCGKVSVDLFVILSGFGLHESYHRMGGGTADTLSNRLRFSVNRLVKMYLNFWPIYIVFGGIFICSGKINLIDIYGHGLMGVKSFVLDFFCLRDLLFEWAKTKTLNATWWYFSVMIVIYIAYPIFKTFAETKYRWLIFVLLLYINFYAPYASYRQFSTGAFFYVSAFYLGILCSELRLFDHLKKARDEGDYVSRVLFCAALVLLTYFFTYTDRFRGELFYAVAIFLLVFTLFIQENGMLYHARKGLILLGKHSGNIFMFHTFFLSYCGWFVYLPRFPILIIVWFLGIMMLISVIFEFLKNKISYSKMEESILRRI